MPNWSQFLRMLVLFSVNVPDTSHFRNLKTIMEGFRLHHGRDLWLWYYFNNYYFRDRLEEPFKDKQPHLYQLTINPDNTFKIRVDNNLVNEGSLLTDFNPPVNPPKEINDPNDKKPDNWDEREKVCLFILYPVINIMYIVYLYINFILDSRSNCQ